MARKTAEERFNEKTQPMSNGCTKWAARIAPNGYGTFWSGQKTVYAHRFAYELSNGPIPSGLVIDHKCHNRACVNPHHLRAITQKQNIENQGVLKSDNSSGYRGVSWSKRSKKWWAYLDHHGKRIHVGFFPTVEAANEAVVEARNNTFTHNDLDRAS